MDKWNPEMIRPVKNSRQDIIVTSPKTREVSAFLIVHSKDRDISLYPSPSRYRIDVADTVGSSFRCSRKVSLHSAIMPNCNSVLAQPYLLLNIDELSGTAFSSTNSASQKAMALMMLDKVYDAKFFNARTDVCRELTQNVSQPLKTLSITIMDQYGEPFDFGQDTGNAVDDSIQHTLVFKLTGDEVAYNRETIWN